MNRKNMRIKIGNKNKRRLYIFLTIILGMLLAVIAYALIDTERINNSSSGELPVSVAGIFLAGGMMLGYVLGVRWWQIVYVEKMRWRRRSSNIALQ